MNCFQLNVFKLQKMDAPWKKKINEGICKDTIGNSPVKNPFLRSFLNSQTQVVLKAQYITFHNLVMFM